MANNVYDDDENKYRRNTSDEMTADQLQDQESDAGSAGDHSDDAGSKQQEKPDTGGGWYKPNKAKKGGIGSLFKSLGGGSKKKKIFLAVGLGGIAPLAVALAVTIMILGQLKGIHFATVMRSAGFAQFQLIMNKAYGQVTFDYATLSDNSTGRLKIKGDRFGFTKKRLTELGNQNKLKWDVSSAGEVKAITIEGKTFSFDDYAKKLFSGKTYSALSTRQKWTVQSRMSTDISEPLSDIVGNKGLLYRSQVYTGLRQTARIEMFRWANLAKGYLGKTPDEAIKLNATETRARVTGSAVDIPVKSSVVEEEEVNQRKADIEEANLKGLDTDDVPVRPSSAKARLASISAKISIAVFITTVGCIIHDISNSFYEMQSQRELGSLKMGHDVLTMADQKRVGDTVTEAVSAENTVWGDATESVWYRQDTGETLTSADQEEIEAIPPIFPTNKFVAAIQWVDGLITGVTIPEDAQIPGMSKELIASYNQSKRDNATAFCSVLMNQYSQALLMVGEVAVAYVTGGISLVVTEGLKGVVWAGAFTVAGDYLNKGIDSLTKNLSGEEYSGLATGKNKYTQARAGTNYFQQIGNRRMAFGAPLTAEESAQNQTIAMSVQRQYQSEGSAYDRYLAISNPFSILGMVVAKIPGSFVEAQNTAASLANTVMSSLLRPWQGLASLGTAKAFADGGSSQAITGENIGIVDYGYTQAEINKIDTDPSFKIDQLDAYFTDAKLQELDDKYMKCYEPYLQSELPEDCKTKTSALYQQGGDEMLKWRWYRALLTADSEGTRGLSSFVGAQTAGGQ